MSALLILILAGFAGGKDFSLLYNKATNENLGFQGLFENCLDCLRVCIYDALGSQIVVMNG